MNDPLSLTKAIEECRAQMSEFCEAAEMDARQRKIRYNAYIVEGFTESQALELIKRA